MVLPFGDVEGFERPNINQKEYVAFPEMKTSSKWTNFDYLSLMASPKILLISLIEAFE